MLALFCSLQSLNRPVSEIIVVSAPVVANAVVAVYWHGGAPSQGLYYSHNCQCGMAGECTHEPCDALVLAILT